MDALIKQTPAKTQQQLSKGDRILFTGADDSAMTKQIQATHAPDGRDINVRHILIIVEDIFNRAIPSIDPAAALATKAQIEALEDKAYNQTIVADMLELLVHVIDRVAGEIAYSSTGGIGDAHTTTLSILSFLSVYSWDSKLVIALAAFAMNYGEFWLLAQTYTTNQLAKSVAILRQLPEVLAHSSVLKPRFDSVNNLIKIVIDIAKCIIDLKELPSNYINMDVPALSAAMTHVPNAVYWAIRSIVVCASQITGIIGLGREHITSTTEFWELSSLAHKLSNMHSHLRTQLGLCYKHIDERKHMETYQNLLNLFEMVHIDNMKVLKALIYAKDDLQPLIDGNTKRRVSIDVLRRKYVLFLISDLDILQEELVILEQIYNESRTHPARQESQYEVLWLPVHDPNIPWNENRLKKFETLQAGMPWHSIYHPSLIDRAVIKFIKDVWNFNKKPMLVVLDPQGRVACPNALHMMWIWGSLAFPFTTLREETLWKGESWKLELLVDGIDPVILDWISEGRYICLYGGEDIEWIRKFTNTARAVAQAAGISLGMVYVGNSNPKERIKRNNATITDEKLSHCWQDLSSIWFFWVRIESMWYSKNQLGRTIEDDPIMQEIMTMLTFDASQGGWAIFSRGSNEMAKAKGGPFLTCLSEYTLWREHVQKKGFIQAIKDHIQGIQSKLPHHCNRLVLPGTSGMIPGRVVCLDCGRPMERFIMYRCCDE